MTTHALERLAGRGRRLDGLMACCGATNAPCARPPGIVDVDACGCLACGHLKSCHAKTWSA